MLYSTEAIILQTHHYGDTSLICNLFSKDYGKLALIAKGVRTLKNPNRAILQPLHYIKVEYYFKPNRNMQLLKEVSIYNHYYEIKNENDWNDPSLDKLWLYHLHYFNDLNSEKSKDQVVWHKNLIERLIAL